jgi:gamma-glutamyltranspeptidase/glutathione hydrolase
MKMQQTPRADLGQGAAATAFPLATEAALSMLKTGGNAVDAAVAAAWTLSVCEPSASGLGGQTTLLIYHADGTSQIIDGHSYAPAGVSLATVSERQQRLGHSACTIPSTPATLGYAQRKYGRLPVAVALAPAIHAASEGYAITPLQRRQATWFERQSVVSEGMAKLFLVNGAAPDVGHVLRQPELAGTLMRLAVHGVEDFYRGQIARDIVADMERHRGMLDATDLAAMALPVEREPLEATYHGMRVLTAPQPAGGMTLLFALKVMEQLLPSVDDARDDESWREAIALASYCTFYERERQAISQDKDELLSADDWLSEANVRAAACSLSENTSVPLAACTEGPNDTTHLAVADAAGNVVALTQSIQSVFGAKVANPKRGFVYNNYLWTCPRHRHVNQLRPGCMPQSNAAPTIVLSHGPRGPEPVVAVGAAGSRRITSSLLQVITQVVDRGRSIEDAIAGPRVHGLLSGKVWIEEPIASPEFLIRLRRRFQQVVVKPALSFGMGCVQGLQWRPDGTILAAADPRRDGSGMTLEEERR